MLRKGVVDTALTKYLHALLVQLPKAQTADDYEALLPWNIALGSD